MPTNIALQGIKTVHTLVWIFFVLCIFAIPVMSWRGDDGLAALFVGIVAIEVAILALNRWHCPMTPLAARFTESRAPNFDIYLPSWLARYNKQIFGSIYAAGAVFAFAMWLFRVTDVGRVVHS
jgi:hypothetical protein